MSRAPDNTGGERAERAVVLHPVLPEEERPGRVEAARRDIAAKLEEAVGLARAIGLDVAHAEAIRLQRVRPATLVGAGMIDTLRELANGLAADLLIVDGRLTPAQQRNLEHALGCKVIDRTALILEIFGERARTREGRLQVELAHLTYQRSRLVRSWTHLERQRGGVGFMGGPGERQIEMDRRIIGERITRLKREIETVRRRRAEQRKARNRVPYSVTALVGYTNAGKTTLFNRLTGANVFAEDLLFATLDPTMRALRLPSGRTIILSDTVGFISDLPTDLVAAFRATLEEVLEADIIVHVRDVSHLDTEAQKADVEKVMREIGTDGGEPAEGHAAFIEALNKIDLLGEGEKDVLRRQAARSNVPAVLLSAANGEGCDALLACMDCALAATRRVLEFSIDLRDGAAIAWLYDKGEVLAREDDEEKAHMRVSLDPADAARFEEKAGRLPH